MTAVLVQFWPVLAIGAAVVVLVPVLVLGCPAGRHAPPGSRPGSRARNELAGGTAMAASVPNTISDKQMAELRRKAERASTESMFSNRNVARRQASNRQKDQAQNN